MTTSKKRFSTTESAAVWLAYDGICTLCETPIVDLRTNTIDHVLPESLQSKPVEFEQIRKLYGLPDNFDLNDFENWIPAHSRCNSRKGQLVFEGVQAMAMILARARRMGQKAKGIYHRMLQERDFASAIATLDYQVSSSAPTIGQLSILRQLIETAEINAAAEAQLLVDPDRWKVVLIKPWGMVVVTDGKHFGDTILRSAPEDMKERWECTHCNGYGPWHLDPKLHLFNCLTCGYTFHG